MLFTFIVRNCGDGCTPARFCQVGREASGVSSKMTTRPAKAACRKYAANAVCDSLFKYGYDGFDIDFQSSFVRLFGQYRHEGFRSIPNRCSGLWASFEAHRPAVGFRARCW